MTLFGCIDDTGTGGIAAGFPVWGRDSTLLDAISGGSPVGDGAPVVRWLSDDGTSGLDQATVAQQPVADAAAFPGRNGIAFTGARNLAYTPGAFCGGLLIVVGPNSGTRTLLSRDTSAASTSPAFELVVEDYFA